MLPQVDRTYLEAHSLEEASKVLGGWAANNQQMDCGRLSLDCNTYSSQKALLQCTSVNRSLLQRNPTPASWLCFGVVTRCGGAMLWNEFSIDESTLLVFQANSSYESLSPVDFQGWTMSYPPEFLALIADKYELQLPVGSLGNSSQAIQISDAQIAGITRLLRLIGVSSQYDQQKIVHELIPVTILSILSACIGSSHSCKGAERKQSLIRARDYIEHYSHEAIGMVDVSQAAHASIRSLQRAFMESYKVSPHEYLRLVRLNRARKALTELRPGDATISGVALDCGFTHLGKFSGVYRQQFGELPRQTLLKST